MIILPIFSCKSGALPRSCCNLAICVKIARLISLFPVVIFCRLRFQSLKSIKNNASISQRVVQKSSIGFAKALLRYLCKNWPISHFLCKIAYTTLGGSSTNRLHDFIFDGH